MLCVLCDVVCVMLKCVMCCVINVAGSNTLQNRQSNVIRNLLHLDYYSPVQRLQSSEYVDVLDEEEFGCL